MPFNHQHEALRRRGFRCVEPTNIHLLSGADAIVQAQSYRSSEEQAGDTPRRKRALMLYELRTESGIEFIDDLELEERLGQEQFARLPIVDLSVYVGRQVVVRDPSSNDDFPGFLYPPQPGATTGRRYRFTYVRRDVFGQSEDREYFLDNESVASLEQTDNERPLFVLRHPIDQ